MNSVDIAAVVCPSAPFRSDGQQAGSGFETTPALASMAGVERSAAAVAGGAMPLHYQKIGILAL